MDDLLQEVLNASLVVVSLGTQKRQLQTHRGLVNERRGGRL